MNENLAEYYKKHESASSKELEKLRKSFVDLTLSTNTKEMAQAENEKKLLEKIIKLEEKLKK